MTSICRGRIPGELGKFLFLVDWDENNEYLLSVLCNSVSKSESGRLNKSSVTEGKVGIQEMKSKCPDKLKMDHLNINSIRNKFDA